jgi:hypothetical protein
MVFNGHAAVDANPTSVVFPALAIGFMLLAFSFIGDVCATPSTPGCGASVNGVLSAGSFMLPREARSAAAIVAGQLSAIRH